MFDSEYKKKLKDNKDLVEKYKNALNLNLEQELCTYLDLSKKFSENELKQLAPGTYKQFKDNLNREQVESRCDVLKTRTGKYRLLKSRSKRSNKRSKRSNKHSKRSNKRSKRSFSKFVV